MNKNLLIGLACVSPFVVCLGYFIYTFPIVIPMILLYALTVFGIVKIQDSIS